MAGPRDAYKVLQVDSEADADVIQAAYRRLAQKFHPDRVGGAGTPEGLEASQRMTEINAAWELLRDPGRRAKYDVERAAGRGWVGPEPAPPPAGPGAAGGSAASGSGARGADAGVPASGNPPGGADRLTFGRYAGWRLDEVLRADPGYLEWLDRTPAGRPYRAEIDALLRRAGGGTRDDGPGRGLPRRG